MAAESRSRSRLAVRAASLTAWASLLSIVGALALTPPTLGQDRRPRDPEPARPSQAERRTDESPAEPDAPETAEVDAESREVAEGGEKVKAIRFSGLDVSGRLKSPQLLYFLNRVRGEFDRPRLPHRSFMPELERSSHGKSF